MPFGEITITLDDVSSIFGILVSSAMVAPLEDDNDTNFELLIKGPASCTSLDSTSRLWHNIDKRAEVRQQLDALNADQVIWEPYKFEREHHPFADVAFYAGMLRCCDVIEPYHPEQVLRQFGRVQTIPPKISDPDMFTVTMYHEGRFSDNFYV
ncbi:unnamed protein product [Prunus brigantina]